MTQYNALTLSALDQEYLRGSNRTAHEDKWHPVMFLQMRYSGKAYYRKQ